MKTRKLTADEAKRLGHDATIETLVRLTQRHENDESGIVAVLNEAIAKIAALRGPTP